MSLLQRNSWSISHCLLYWESWSLVHELYAHASLSDRPCRGYEHCFELARLLLIAHAILILQFLPIGLKIQEGHTESPGAFSIAGPHFQDSCSVPESATPLLQIRSQEKGVLAKGVSAESSVTPRKTKHIQGYGPSSTCVTQSA